MTRRSRTSIVKARLTQAAEIVRIVAIAVGIVENVAAAEDVPVAVAAVVVVAAAADAEEAAGVTAVAMVGMVVTAAAGDTRLKTQLLFV